MNKKQKYNVGNTFKSPSVLSFCTGLRGLERGLERAIGPIREIACVEIEAFAVANLVAQMEAGSLAPCPIWTDLKTFPAKVFRKRTDIIIGGYPCQPFSLAGTRLGESDSRHLWPFIEMHVSAIRASTLFFENVDDHLSLGFPTVYRSLRRMGYAVEAGIYSAEEVGAPHERNRLFILALEHTYCKQIRNLWKHHPEKFPFLIRSGNQKLAYANSILSGGGSGNISGAAETPKGEAWIQNRQWRWNQSEYSGETMEHSNDQGLQKWTGGRSPDELQTTERAGIGEEMADTNSSGSRQNSEPGELWPGWLIKSPGYSWRGDAEFLGFPAGAGPAQFPWEEPRTVKPRFCVDADGYHYREDILRCLGNMVVEQQAEVAFIELLLKLLS